MDFNPPSVLRPVLLIVPFEVAVGWHLHKSEEKIAEHCYVCCEDFL